MNRRGNYGIDAPWFPTVFGGFTAIAVVAMIVAWLCGQTRTAAMAALYALVFGVNVASYLHTTLRGKFAAWEDILDELPLTGRERLLDLGCGRGAVLIAAARRLTTGHATGIDLWNRSDQSGNAPAATRRNLELEGVAGRATLTTGDMRHLPFASDSFDVVVSSLAIHNIPSTAGRAAAIAEAFRVLRPGGRLAIADIRCVALYARTLRGLGAIDVVRRRLGWRFWYGNPIAATTLVTARKA